MNCARLQRTGAGTALALGLSAAVLPITPVQATVAPWTLVPCHDVTALTDAISQANTGGSGRILLAAGCTYTLTAPTTPGGADGLPVITGDIRISSSRSMVPATITRATTSGTPAFRIFHVTGGTLTLDRRSASPTAKPRPAGWVSMASGLEQVLAHWLLFRCGACAAERGRWVAVAAGGGG
jgi:hypothetical protein